ncbi:MAG: hypothetical protein IPG76_18115 [Acidobacteria bacterium]|nr:hypothetical protein [Acidobacteriota bacterium]
MQVGAVETTVEITAETPLVQTASSTVQTSMTVRQVQDLPLNGRNPLQLVALTAGANISNSGTIGVQGQQDNAGISVNGLRPTPEQLAARWIQLQQQVLRFGAGASQSGYARRVHRAVGEL